MGLAPDDPRHGTTNGYVNLHCRCEACRAAWAVDHKRMQDKRAAKLAENPNVVPHGRASTYGNWKCRCRPCTDAWAVALAKIPSKTKNRLEGVSRLG